METEKIDRPIERYDELVKYTVQLINVYTNQTPNICTQEQRRNLSSIKLFESLHNRGCKVISNDNRKPTRTSSFLWKKPAKSILVWNTRMDVFSRRKYRGKFVTRFRCYLFHLLIGNSFRRRSIGRNIIQWNGIDYCSPICNNSNSRWWSRSKRASCNSLFSRTNFQSVSKEFCAWAFFHRFRPSKNTFKYLLTYEKRLLYTFYIEIKWQISISRNLKLPLFIRKSITRVLSDRGTNKLNIFVSSRN